MIVFVLGVWGTGGVCIRWSTGLAACSRCINVHLPLGDDARLFVSVDAPGADATAIAGFADAAPTLSGQRSPTRPGPAVSPRHVFVGGSLTSPFRTKATMVKGIAFTAYPVNDVAGKRRWYEEKLGLQFAGPYVEDGIEKYNEAHVGNECFSLMAAEWTERAAGSASSAYFEVDNVDGLVASLQANGVTIEDRFEGPVCKQASFCDPEGNRVAVHESTARRS